MKNINIYGHMEGIGGIGIIPYDHIQLKPKGVAKWGRSLVVGRGQLLAIGGNRGPRASLG